MKIMEYRPIEVKLISGKDLKDVNVFSTMDVYVVGSVSGDPRSMQRTGVHKDGGTNPKWNHVMKFNVDESAARLNRLGLVFQIMSDRTLGDKEVGRVYVPLKELFDAVGVVDEHSVDVSGEEKNVVYQVQTSTGRFKGQLEFCYKFGEKFTQAAFDRKLDSAVLQLDRKSNGSDLALHEPYPTPNQKLNNEPVMAYPAGPSTMPGPGPRPEPTPGPNAYPGVGVGGSAPYAYGGPPPGYAPQGYGHGNGNGYGLPPQQAPPPPPNVQMGYGYGYPGGYGHPGQASTGYVQQQVQPPPKKGHKFGMGAAAGLGAGLLGGMLVGEMVEDVAETAVYDDMYGF